MKDVSENVNLKNNSKSLELSFEGVSFAWSNGKKTVNDCSFRLPGKGLWMLVGANGSGKSTLFRLISGMISPDQGLMRCSYKSFMMFQNPDHQLLLPTCGSDLLLSTSLDLSTNERFKKVQDALIKVGLAEMQDRPIHTLSGGQKQRLALAGALISESNLLLLDEPTALLDPESQIAVLETVQSLCQQADKHISALWITHRLEELEFCDGAAKMENGKIGPWLKCPFLSKQLFGLAGRRV